VLMLLLMPFLNHRSSFRSLYVIVLLRYVVSRELTDGTRY